MKAATAASVCCLIILALIALGVDAKINGVNTEQQSRKQCWSSGNGQLAKFWDEGSRIDRGMYQLLFWGWTSF